jgi:hypothetical protein
MQETRGAQGSSCFTHSSQGTQARKVNTV